MKGWQSLAGMLACVLAVTTGHAQKIERIPSPEGVFYYQPAASVFGSEAAWTNPAALGSFSVQGMQVMADYFDGSFAKSWGALLQEEKLAIAYRHVRNPLGTDYKQAVFAGGFSLQKEMSLGVSYSYYFNGPDYYRKLHSWSLSLHSSQSGPFRWGAVWSNLNRASINNERTEIEQRFSLAYRPMDEKLTLAVDMFLSTKTRFSNADYVYHVELNPTPGVFVNGYVDSDKNYQVGARVNLLQYFTGAKSSYAKGGKERGTTVFGGWYSLRQPSPLKPPRKRVTAGLSGSLRENPPQPVFGARSVPFVKQILSIYQASDDPSVDAMLVRIGSTGFAKAQEIREALLQFKSRGKRLYCFLEEQSNIAYYIASIADSIIIPPVCELNLVGLRSELTFYAGTLEKLGIKIDLLRIGEYKTAAEAYTNRSASEENRAQVNRILDDISDQFVSGIAGGRKLTPDSVRAIIDRGPYTSKEALDFKLVDMVCYEDQLDSSLGFNRAHSLSRYIADSTIAITWKKKPVLAILVADGEITGGGGSSPFESKGEVTPYWTKRGVGAICGNPDVRGVVYRINSPGGSALASDDILHEMRKLPEHLPLVVSMGNVAGSGGYFVAMTAQRIFAMPATRVGSIGIYGGKADYSGLHQKIALGKELYTRGRFAGMMTSIRPFTEEERGKYMGHLQAFYGEFIRLVSQNRGVTEDSVNALGRGQVWTGREAIGNGLIDETGGLKQALDFLAKEQGVLNYAVEVYPVDRPLFLIPNWSVMNLIGGFLGSHSQERETEIDEISRALRLADDHLIARIPYDIVVE